MKEQKSSVLEKLRERRALPSSAYSSFNLNGIIADEWTAFSKQGQENKENGLSNMFVEASDPIELSAEDYVDVMQYLEQELLSDLKKEETFLLTQYEETNDFEEAALSAAVEDFYTAEVSQIVICPLCKQNPLHQNKGIIFCRCGLRLDVQKEHITLDYLYGRLNEACQTHNSGCPQEPEFKMTNQFGLSAICLSCSQCNTFLIIV